MTSHSIALERVSSCNVVPLPHSQSHPKGSHCAPLTSSVPWLTPQYLPSTKYASHMRELGKGIWSNGSISERNPAVQNHLHLIRQNPIIPRTCPTVVFAVAALAVFYTPMDSAHWHFWGGDDMRLETAKIVNSVYFHKQRLIHTKVSWIGIPENLFLLKIIQGSRKSDLAETSWHPVFQLPSNTSHSSNGAAKRILRKRKAQTIIEDTASLSGDDDAEVSLRPVRKKPRVTRTVSTAKTVDAAVVEAAVEITAEVASRAPSSVPSELTPLPEISSLPSLTPPMDSVLNSPKRNRSASQSSAETTVTDSTETRHRRSVSRSSATTVVNSVSNPTPDEKNIAEIIPIIVGANETEDDDAKDDETLPPPLARSRRSIRVTARAAAAVAHAEDFDENDNDNDGQGEEQNTTQSISAKTPRNATSVKRKAASGNAAATKPKPKTRRGKRKY